MTAPVLTNLDVDEGRATELANIGLSLGKKGSMEVRLTRNEHEVAACQKLRFKVFYEEMAARADEETFASKTDVDAFDAICDHLLVIDHALRDYSDAIILGDEAGAVVGTYRLLRQEVAEQHGGFYTSGEYDISELIKRKSSQCRFLELGRSCVLKPYRTRPTVELLWQGIWTYVRIHKLDVMIGCASFEGINPKELAIPLSYLHHQHQAPESWHVKAVADRYVDMNFVGVDEINIKSVLHTLPPLIKGYLRLGAYIGDGAVIDHQFNTTDVLIILPVDAIKGRYAAHFKAAEKMNIDARAN